MKSLLILSLLMVAVWATSIPTLILINLIVYTIKASWLRSLLGIIVFGGWVTLWYTLLRFISRKILSARFSKTNENLVNS